MKPMLKWRVFYDLKMNYKMMSWHENFKLCARSSHLSASSSPPLSPSLSSSRWALYPCIWLEIWTAVYHSCFGQQHVHRAREQGGHQHTTLENPPNEQKKIRETVIKFEKTAGQRPFANHEDASRVGRWKFELLFYQVYSHTDIMQTVWISAESTYLYLRTYI